MINTQIKIVIIDDDKKLLSFSLKISCTAYGTSIKTPRTTSNIPVIKKIVLFDTIKPGQYLNGNKIQLIINLTNARL